MFNKLSVSDGVRGVLLFPGVPYGVPNGVCDLSGVPCAIRRGEGE